MARRFLLVCLAFIIAATVSAEQSPRDRLLSNIKVISYNREEEEAFSFILFILGLPKKIFHYSGCDILFYPKLSTSLTSEELKNVYIVVRDGEITDVKISRFSLNPYNEFETYP